MKLNELENVLLNQIEMLNDDSIGEDKEQIKNMVERSKAISSLASNVMDLNRFKLSVVEHCEHNGTMYESFLGIEDHSTKTKKAAK